MKKTRTKKIKEAREFDKIVADARQDSFKFHLDMCGVKSEGVGATALEALHALKPPVKITTKGVLTISVGDRKKEILLSVQRLKRLFYPNFQLVNVKNLVYGL